MKKVIINELNHILLYERNKIRYSIFMEKKAIKIFDNKLNVFEIIKTSKSNNTDIINLKDLLDLLLESNNKLIDINKEELIVYLKNILKKDKEIDSIEEYKINNILKVKEDHTFLCNNVSGYYSDVSFFIYKDGRIYNSKSETFIPLTQVDKFWRDLYFSKQTLFEYSIEKNDFIGRCIPIKINGIYEKVKIFKVEEQIKDLFKVTIEFRNDKIILNKLISLNELKNL